MDFAEQCGQQFDSGPCVGSFKRFFFDVSDQLCHSFEFSGCGGNSNNYRTLEECQQTCLKLKNANQTITGDESHNTSDGQSCRFNGHIYAIGDRLDIGQTCVECRCRVPPDMTCVHQSCPSPPSDDCKVSYNPSSCCPLFDCNYNKSKRKSSQHSFVYISASHKDSAVSLDINSISLESRYALKTVFWSLVSLTYGYYNRLAFP